ncbi:SmtA SAM-dependent methyltransferases [Candidatus Pelagibacterales bacterium]|jgi:SAM-dependent methyltransferase
MNILKNKLGIFLYMILPIRFAWSLINKHEKKRILKNDYNFNNSRSDYCAKSYQRGMSWDKFSLKNDYRKWIPTISKFLGKNKSLKILEIGPGSGFYTRYICDHKNISHYSFYEINKSFSSYLKKKLKSLKKNKFSYSEIDIKKNVYYQNINTKYDMIIFLSSFHHIPNRNFFIKKIEFLLKNNGKILFIEPTHYFFRIIGLFKKFIFIYRRYTYESLYKNISTHHFCTLKEFKIFFKKKQINYEFLVQSKKINFLLKFLDNILLNYIKKLIKCFYSYMMIVTIVKKS